MTTMLAYEKTCCRILFSCGSELSAMCCLVSLGPSELQDFTCQTTPPTIAAWILNRCHAWCGLMISAKQEKRLCSRSSWPGQTAYKARVKRLMESPPAQQKAKRFYTNLCTVCKKIAESKAHAVKGWVRFFVFRYLLARERRLFLQRTLHVKATLFTLRHKSCLSRLSS